MVKPKEKREAVSHSGSLFLTVSTPCGSERESGTAGGEHLHLIFQRCLYETTIKITRKRDAHVPIIQKIPGGGDELPPIRGGRWFHEGNRIAAYGYSEAVG